MASPERSYSSPVRADQARQTRKRIVDAGAALFAERGYGATTIDAIAQAAGVSRKTVFDSVGGKANLMKLAYDFAITGDDAPIPLMDRPRIADLMAEREPAAMIAGHAALVTDIGSRIAANLLRAGAGGRHRRGGAGAVPGTGAAAPDLDGRCRRKLLAEAGGLRPGLTRTHGRGSAVDLLRSRPLRQARGPAGLVGRAVRELDPPDPRAATAGALSR